MESEQRTGKHTPEPWVISEYPAPSGRTHLQLEGGIGFIIDMHPNENYPRIVAAVNALQGIDNPAAFREMAEAAMALAEAIEDDMIAPSDLLDNYRALKEKPR